ncbi:MAG: hypothetical protein Q9197_002428 [Variospora fuerteventurae]
MGYVSGARVPSETSTLNLSAAAKLLSPKSFSHEQFTLPTAAVAPPMEAQSVIPIAKSTPGVAARVMAGVGTRLVTAAPAASLAAQRLLRLRIPPRPDQTAVAEKTLVVRHVTPMALMEAAAQRMDTAGSHPITAVPAARTDAVVQTHLQLNLQQHHLRKNPSWAYQPRAPPPTEKRQMAVAVPPTVEPFVAPGRREAVAPHTVSVARLLPTAGRVVRAALAQTGFLYQLPAPPRLRQTPTQNGRVVFLDKVEDYTQLKLPNGQFAYSSEYDPATNKVVPLSYKTNAFCSGGAFLADGRFVSIGGNAPLDFLDPTVGDGFDGIRYLTRSATDASLNGQGWSEPGNKIASARWYASVQTMPDSTLFVASGSLNGLDPTKPENNNPTYEVLNAQGVSNGRNIPMEILRKNQPYYMYPFIHLLNNGQLFVQVSKSAEIFNVATNTVTKALPDIPGDYRTYPNTGGSVLLPLSSGNGYAPEVMICGGGAYQDITSPTDPSCGRIQPLAATPRWEMDSMNEGRGMVEGTLLPDGTVIWVNGANQGAQGFGVARTPTYQVLIYDPVKPLGQRWSRGPTSTIARLYHSVAVLLLDGTLMIAGSNPVEQPILKPVPGKVPSEDFVTEFRIEIYTPPYLSGPNANKRPTGLTLSSKSLKADGSTFTVRFTAPAGNKVARVALYHGGFVTHSLHMNHRMVFLDTTGYRAGATSQTLTVKMPPNRNVAHAGPYVVYVTVDGVPAIGQFVSVA